MFVSIWIAIFLPLAILILGIFLLVKLNFKREWVTIVSSFLLLILAIGSLVLYICIVQSHTHKIDEQHYIDTVNEYELCAVQADTVIDGERYLVSSSDVYKYYYKINNRICQSNAPANMSFIEYIGEGESPRLVEYHDYWIATYLYDVTEELKDTKPLDSWNYYVFYVPEDSVVETYDFT